MNIFNLLTSSSGESTGGGNGGGNTVLLIVLGVFVVGWIVLSFFTNKKRKKQAEEESKKRDVKPGFIVTTIGGIVGTVVSVDEENSTFILETGSEENHSQLKFDKLAIYNSVDPNAATAEPETAPAPETDVFENNEGETPVAEGEATETAETTVSDETPESAEAAAEEKNQDKE